MSQPVIKNGYDLIAAARNEFKQANSFSATDVQALASQQIRPLVLEASKLNYEALKIEGTLRATLPNEQISDDVLKRKAFAEINISRLRLFITQQSASLKPLERSISIPVFEAAVGSLANHALLSEEVFKTGFDDIAKLLKARFQKEPVLLTQDEAVAALLSDFGERAALSVEKLNQAVLLLREVRKLLQSSASSDSASAENPGTRDFAAD